MQVQAHLNFQIGCKVFDELVEVVDVFLLVVAQRLLQSCVKVKRQVILFVNSIQYIQFALKLSFLAICVLEDGCQRSTCK